MPPNIGNVAYDPGNFDRRDQSASTTHLIKDSNENYKLKIFNSSLNTLAHLLVGAITSLALFYSFRNGIPLGATPLHIVLCVIGYQLLMAQAILSLSPHNAWSANLKLLHKRRAHWTLQIMGSGLAIAGSVIKYLDNNIHFNTLHGQFVSALINDVVTEEHENL